MVIFVLINSVDEESYHIFNQYIVQSLTVYSFTVGGDKGTTTNIGKLNVPRGRYENMIPPGLPLTRLSGLQLHP
ncbi:hypothetical protein C2767_17095 [Klebsiella quasipneumoniae]|nr:hypothetical protein DP204_17270 [Klebsiella quasipneumoniae subsp. quasipneumoniae]PCM63929.1 hypothetical protein CP910_25195 [Klebsiella pneumoniae]PCR29211.1 hypothetical protein CQA86_13420 [Klebsiella pneumoniae]QEY79233.1 hypothetical protein C2767_17095 [Klebsiella quasipneumoniae]